ncbi:uncharacterized protein N0V89_012012 [Didymosphaeria variabile]|uniref:Uncharacterized protein n=1 Tax=Didymosphaeria variabile TaxID=1932322 RepID=A0A9W8XB49_9PLEO|nr:uncharacterized protein N0V89_012012 [Didymosphaeria variabile]KAJ4345876.1 hypothetical protein N0V89_012012 [Didymosphaeria variabile]
MDLDYDFETAEAKAGAFCEAAEAVISNVKSMEQTREDLRLLLERTRTFLNEKESLESDLRNIEALSAKARELDKNRAAMSPRVRRHVDDYKKDMKDLKEKIRKKEAELRESYEEYEEEKVRLATAENAQIEEMKNALEAYRGEATGPLVT